MTFKDYITETTKEFKKQEVEYLQDLAKKINAKEKPTIWPNGMIRMVIDYSTDIDIRNDLVISKSPFDGQTYLLGVEFNVRKPGYRQNQSAQEYYDLNVKSAKDITPEMIKKGVKELKATKNFIKQIDKYDSEIDFIRVI